MTKPAKLAPRGKRVVAWLLVDRHGFPDQVYGRLGHPSLSPKRRAEKAAIRMNACGPSPDQDKFGPWRAQRIEYVVPRMASARKGGGK